MIWSIFHRRLVPWLVRGMNNMSQWIASSLGSCQNYYTPVQKQWDLFFKCIFDLSVINILKQAFNMTFIRCFMRMMWNFICLWLFIGLYDHSKLVRFENRDIKKLATGTVLVVISLCATDCFGHSNYFYFMGRARPYIHTNIYEITRLTSLSYLSILSGSSSCIDDSDKPPSNARYEATNARLIYRLQSLVHSPAKLLGISR